MMTGFTIYPAIDLHAGQVVRLSQGDLKRQTVYSRDPGVTARCWLEAGARWLHVVNLDGAFENPDQANRAALRDILAATQSFSPIRQVQLGGGLRSLVAALQALESGVSRVVLGTAAVQSPELIRHLLEQCGAERVAVGLDARDGKVRLRGWTVDSTLNMEDLVQHFAGMGLRTVIYTDIARDGMGAGVNVAASLTLAQTSGLEVIASGGVHSLEDIQQVRQAGLSGVIVGRALYEGRLRLEEALALERE
jgi:phosphoribosylformimino-5-aminoimidazole carboxamide ribotide isomerase